MSTILDALQKARREHQHDGGADSLDRLTAAQAAPPRRVPRRSVAAVVILTIAATVLTLLLVGGAFTMLNQRMRSLVARSGSGAGVVPGAPSPMPAAGRGSAAPAASGPASDPLFPALPAASALATSSVELPVAGPVPSADPAALLPPPVPAAQVPPAAATAASPATATPPAAKEGFTLGSILYDDQVRIATVNGVALREGEEYSGFRVLRIMRDAVIVQRDRDDPVTLRLAR